MTPIDPKLKAALDELGLRPTEEAWRQLVFIGALLRESGRLDDALSVFRLALQLALHLHGGDHPNTLVSITNMGALLRDQGKLTEAEPFFREALEKYRRVLGEEHPDTLWSINRMGALLLSQGKLQEAEPFVCEALEKCRCVLGEEHPDTLSSIKNMGSLLLYQGKLTEAEPFFREALEKRRHVLGEEHPDTIAAINDIGALLGSQGRLDEAEPLNRGALEKCRRVLGEEHPDTLTSITNMGCLLREQGSLSEAERLFTEALAIAQSLRASALGADSRAMLSEQLNLSLTSVIASVLRARLQRSAASVLDAIEAGSSRSVLDLLQSNAMDKRAAAAERLTPQQANRYDSDLTRLAELEFQEKQLLDKGVALSDSARQAIALELSQIRQRLVEVERRLLPSAETRDLSKIRQALRSGEVLLLYGWSRWGVSLVAVPDAASGHEPSAHWVSRVEDATKPSETNKREQALIAVMESVAVLTAAGLAPDPTRAPNAAKALSVVNANADLVTLLGTRVMDDIRRLVNDLTTAAVGLVDNPTRHVPVRSMSLDSLRPLSRMLLNFALPEAIRPMLEQATRVIVAPSGPLHELPLDVLVELANFTELRNKPITLVPSGSILALIRGRDKSVNHDGITAVGDPDADLPGPSRAGDPTAVSELEALLGTPRAAGQGRLPLARTEATLVAEYRSGQPILGEQATPSRLHREAPNHRVLHIAAHAVLGEMGNPMASAILLSREVGSEGTSGTGQLSVGDLIATWSDRLKGCELAVLSCCQTGRGVQVGDSVMALPIGLLHAGVHAIVASLWKVDDLATCLLMARFHQNLLGDHRTLTDAKDTSSREVWGKQCQHGEPMPAPHALAEARSWLRTLESKTLSAFAESPHYKADEIPGKSGTPLQVAQHRANTTGTRPFAHPIYWAAFVLIGE